MAGASKINGRKEPGQRLKSFVPRQQVALPRFSSIAISSIRNCLRSSPVAVGRGVEVLVEFVGRREIR